MFLDVTAVTTGSNYTCGNLTNFVFDGQFPSIVSTIILVIEIGIPLILIIMGMLDLGKAVMAQKEDEIKKGQSMFFKRLMAAAIVFFVIFIVKLLVGLVAPGEATKANISNCIKCFTTGQVYSDGTSCANHN